MEARPEGAGPSSGLLLPPEWALPAAEEPPTAGPPQHLRVRMRVTHHQGQAQAGRGPCGQGRESLCWSRPPRHRGSCSAGGPVSASAGASRWVFLNLLGYPTSLSHLSYSAGR